MAGNLEEEKHKRPTQQDRSAGDLIEPDLIDLMKKWQVKGATPSMENRVLNAYRLEMSGRRSSVARKPSLLNRVENIFSNFRNLSPVFVVAGGIIIAALIGAFIYFQSVVKNNRDYLVVN